MTTTLLIRRLLAAEARPGSATRRRMLLSLVGFASALCVASSHVSPLPADPAAAPAIAALAATAPAIAPDVRVALGESGVTRGGSQDFALLRDVGAAARPDRE